MVPANRRRRAASSGQAHTVAWTVIRFPARSSSSVRVAPGLPRRASITVPMGAFVTSRASTRTSLSSGLDAATTGRPFARHHTGHGERPSLSARTVRPTMSRSRRGRRARPPPAHLAREIDFQSIARQSFGAEETDDRRRPTSASTSRIFPGRYRGPRRRAPPVDPIGIAGSRSSVPCVSKGKPEEIRGAGRADACGQSGCAASQAAVSLSLTRCRPSRCPRRGPPFRRRSSSRP